MSKTSLSVLIMSSPMMIIPRLFPLTNHVPSVSFRTSSISFSEALLSPFKLWVNSSTRNGPFSTEPLLEDCAIFSVFGKEFPKFCSLVYSGGLSRDLDEIFVEIQDPNSNEKNTISLRSLLEKEKLNGINFLDWFRNLRIVLKQERKEYVIEEAVPNDPGPNASRADKDKFKKHMNDMLDVGCLMLATMTPELQKQHENMVAYEMIQNLKENYEGQARQARYETSKALFQCKMSEGSPVGAHVIKMMGYIQTLEKLGFALNNELAVDVVLQSLSDSFNQFVLNFNMNEINKTLPQLLGMLRTAEGNMKKGGSKSILMVREAKGKGKKVAKSKGTGKTKPKGKEALKPKGGVSKDGKCFHCGKPGHWKRNCPVYLEEVKKAKAVGASVSGIYVIDVNMSTSTSWVLDTGSGSHICTSVQGLHMRRNLAKGDVDLRVGNGARVAALAVGTYVLSLPMVMCRCATTRTEKEEMPQYSRKDDEQRDAATLVH
ncbi:hypothetical protein V6N12_050683 [Hibiscus sabdariffa]|uniref:CCHC-type domain-containing protein n=1 Tax=Hibiscus sabdariffa TaxID=183260 RepID=A0ABR2GDF2_9ROSI